MYIIILTIQPALIKLDNKNIGGHCTPLQQQLLYAIFDLHRRTDRSKQNKKLSIQQRNRALRQLHLSVLG